MPPERPPRADSTGENGEGTGWPRDKGKETDRGTDKGTDKNADESPEKTRIRELESELGKTKTELMYTQGALIRTRQQLERTRTELGKAQDERSKLVDTVSRQGRQLERKDAEITELRSPTPALARKEQDDATQDRVKENKPGRRNWFPSEKVSAVASGGISALGAAGVAAHQITGSTESAIVAGAGFGFTVLALAKDRYEKRQEKKDADRPAGQ